MTIITTMGFYGQRVTINKGMPGKKLSISDNCELGTKQNTNGNGLPGYKPSGSELRRREKYEKKSTSGGRRKGRNDQRTTGPSSDVTWQNSRRC
jgi:hypothetical protein